MTLRHLNCCRSAQAWLRRRFRGGGRFSRSRRPGNREGQFEMADVVPVIYGAGAIGGLIGAYAQRDGLNVLLADKVPEHVRRMNAEGLHVFGSRGEFTVPVTAVLPEDLPDGLELVLLAVKGQDTAAALDVLAPKLSPTGAIVSLQN